MLNSKRSGTIIKIKDKSISQLLEPSNKKKSFKVESNNDVYPIYFLIFHIYPSTTISDNWDLKIKRSRKLKNMWKSSFFDNESQRLLVRLSVESSLGVLHLLFIIHKSLKSDFRPSWFISILTFLVRYFARRLCLITLANGLFVI